MLITVATHVTEAIINSQFIALPPKSLFLQKTGLSFLGDLTAEKIRHFHKKVYLFFDFLH